MLPKAQGECRGQDLVPTPPDDMLPQVAELLNAHWLDQEVHCPVGHALQHHRGLPIGGHHCKSSQHLSIKKSTVCGGMEAFVRLGRAKFGAER